MVGQHGTESTLLTEGSFQTTILIIFQFSCALGIDKSLLLHNRSLNLLLRFPNSVYLTKKTTNEAQKNSFLFPFFVVAT